MAERSRKSRPTAGLCAAQRGADELRRRSTNSSPMNEGKFPVRGASRTRKTLKESRYGRAPFALLVAPSRACPEMAPQRLEKIESAPGNGMASEASKPQHLVHRRAANRALRRTNLGARLRPSGDGSRIRSAGRRIGNFPPRNPLESLKTGIESRRRLRLSGHGLRIRRARTPREKTLQKKAPNVLKSHDAELKSAEASEGSRRGSVDAGYPSADRPAKLRFLGVVRE
jgi:hypothetical protein